MNPLRETAASTSGAHEDPAPVEPGGTHLQPGTAIVTASRLNLRSSPAAHAGNVIGGLDRGERVQVLSGEPRNGFYEVEFAGHEHAWAFGRYLDRGVVAGGDAAVQRILGPGPTAPPPAQHTPAPDGIALADDARTPPTLSPGSDENAVPLSFTGLVASAGPHEARRIDGPISGSRGKVRVLLERLENIEAAFALPNALNLCGSPEHLTLFPGDEIEIYSWNENLAGSPIDVGFAASRALGDVLTGVHVVAGEGISYGVKLHSPPLQGEYNSVFGATLNKGALGGCCLRATVKDVQGGKPFDLTLTQAVRRAGNATHDVWTHGENVANEMIEAGLGPQFAKRKAEEAKEPEGKRASDAVLAQQVHQQTGKAGGFNEQGQFYGNLEGAFTLEQGKRQLIAPPGDSAYGAAGTDRSKHYADRGAAYWTPVHVDMVAGAGVRGFKIAPYSEGKDQAFIRVRVVDKQGNEHVPATILSRAAGERVHGTFASGPLQLQIEFLGGSVTGVYVTAE